MYQVHDEVELYGEVNNEENTGPTVLGVCWHHHIRKTRRKRGNIQNENYRLNLNTHAVWQNIHDELQKKEVLLARSV